VLLNNNEYLKHYGILGMRWGKRKGITTADLTKMANKDEALKAKLNKTESKADKNQVKVDKLQKKLTKHGGYITDIGYTLAERTGRKLARKLHKGQKLDKKITKIKQKIEKNQALMKSKLKDLPKDQIKIGKSIVDAALKG
jgi:ribosomal protein S8